MRSLTTVSRAIECGWLKDKYGLAWQIVPTVLFEMMADKDEARKERVVRSRSS
ncbi:MAG: VOC family protein [Bryobacteraceae bacterium]